MTEDIFDASGAKGWFPNVEGDVRNGTAKERALAATLQKAFELEATELIERSILDITSRSSPTGACGEGAGDAGSEAEGGAQQRSTCAALAADRAFDGIAMAGGCALNVSQNFEIELQKYYLNFNSNLISASSGSEPTSLRRRPTLPIA